MDADSEMLSSLKKLETKKTNPKSRGKEHEAEAGQKQGFTPLRKLECSCY